MWKAKKVKIRLFGLFRPKSGPSKKKDQFRRIFSKRSVIRPILIKRTYLAALHQQDLSSQVKRSRVKAVTCSEQFLLAPSLLTWSAWLRMFLRPDTRGSHWLE